MKSIPFFALGLLAACSLSSCSNDETTSTTTSDTAAVSTTMEATPPASTTTTTTTHSLVETETYTDLKTGKTFRVKRDASGNWAADNGGSLDYYYSSSGDTFYGPSARWVNNSLINNNGNYSVDETRWNEMNSGSMDNTMSMDADKVKMNDEELKVKSADGDAKLKVTDDKTKLKTSDVKIKEDEDGIKVKNR